MLLLGALVFSPSGRTQTAEVTPATSAELSATLNQYCLGCHSAKVATAGIVLDPSEENLTRANLAEKAELWERVVRQLNAQTMPPPAMPRPASEVYHQMAAFLEGELDAAAEANPNPGNLPKLHRLTRTEYKNAIRDLLGLDNLPKELDYSLLLPADNASSGFDNLADLLFVSPTIMDRYLEAAMKISRLAVGDPEAPVLVNIYRTELQQPQDYRGEDLPFGTRGGVSIEAYFPMDGQYVFDLDMAGFAREAYDLEISVDGERAYYKESKPAGRGGFGRGGGRGGFGRGPAAAPEPEIRIPITAGPHRIGVTFAQTTNAFAESVLKPRNRSRGALPALDTVTVRGPYDVTGRGDTPSRRAIFTCYPTAATQEEACAHQIVARLTKLAYRRPVTDDDLVEIMDFYEEGRQERDFDFGVQSAIERLLVSPQFMYRIETDPPGAKAGTIYRISDLEFASRLSFFLWSSLPDEELIDLAANGTLRNPDVLRGQVNRMLADSRAESLVDNFAAQWLFLRDVAQKEPDLFLFQNFDENLRQAFEHETELFLRSILLDPNRSVLDLLTANHTFVNERLAEHYGIPNILGSRFQRVEWPEGSPRAGLLGQGSILLLTSYSTRTSPVLRGKYILENLLAAPPPPPPPNVPSLNTEGESGEQQLTLREAMVLHRANPVCASCHARMDPIGFAMENFDAIGRWRDTDGGQEIDVVSKLPDGTEVAGIEGVRQLLLKDPKRFAGAVAEKLMMYATGRNVQYYDQPAIRKIIRDAAKENYTFASLVSGVVNSSPFQLRAVSAAANGNAAGGGE